MREIARLPVQERHDLLRRTIPAMAQDFEDDPTLSEFSDLNMHDWAIDDVGT